MSMSNYEKLAFYKFFFSYFIYSLQFLIINKNFATKFKITCILQILYIFINFNYIFKIRIIKLT